MQRRIRRRYAAERRFRLVGLGAVLLSAGFLAFLLVTMLANGLGGFARPRSGSTSARPRRRRSRRAIPRPRSAERRLFRRRLAAAARCGRAAGHGLAARLGRDRRRRQGRRQRRGGAAYRRLDRRGPGADPDQLAFLTGADATDPTAGRHLGRVQGLAADHDRDDRCIAFPIGVLSAVYLEEYAPRNRWTDMIEVSINNLAAVPSIIFGLLGLAIFLNFMHLPRSAPIVGGLTLALMTMPVIVIAGRNAIKSVPPSIRDAALGIGASRIQVVFHHVLPLALPGILTGTIIGMARALGETAPLLMIGMRAFIAAPPGGLSEPATVLPVQIFLWSDEVSRGFVEKTSAAIIVLLVFLLAMNGLAIYLRNRFEKRW